jgi:hypothetical protein
LSNIVKSCFKFYFSYKLLQKQYPLFSLQTVGVAKFPVLGLIPEKVRVFCIPYAGIGPSAVVEIDESKFGERNYNRGHRVGGVWIFVMIKKTG